MKPLLDACMDKFTVEDECFVWTGTRNYAGYAILNRDYKMRKVHRLLYEELVGPIPEGHEIDHLCRNKSCINPDHLEAVTHRENLLRGDAPAAINARKTHCIRGHEFTLENSYIRESDGGRICSICERVRKGR